LAILSKMAQKPEVNFDQLFPKLYNVELWILAYQILAPKPGNMSAGVDGTTIDGTGLELIHDTIAQLKASRYVPKPVRRIYVPKPNNRGQRPIGIACFQDKLVQTVLKLILEAIYEPTFADTSHGFRPNRSCHTALEQVKQMRGTRWWIEGDIHSFFDTMGHDILLGILAKRIADQRFVHLIGQFLKAGYLENWQYHLTYSGVAQGGNLSPLLSNIYLNELDQLMAAKIAQFNRGQVRQLNPEYQRVRWQAHRLKKKARKTGKWEPYKMAKQKMLSLPATDPQDPNFRRLQYVRYGDDWLVSVIGSKADALELKQALGDFLKNELQLELSVEKTLVTNAKNKVRFLGYEIGRWKKLRKLRFRTRYGVTTQRTTHYQPVLFLPHLKAVKFGKEYGDPTLWRGKARPKLQNLSELEILSTFNAEIRGFLGYYALADNLKKEASRLLWLTTQSFLLTLAGKRRSSLNKVATSLKKRQNRYALKLLKKVGTIKEYELVSSTTQLKQEKVSYGQPDLKPNLWPYRSRTELGKRLLAQLCEWCGTTQPPFEVHHVRKLKDLKGKTNWEQQMIQRRRKTMVLCQECHHLLHAGKLSENRKAKRKLES